MSAYLLSCCRIYAPPVMVSLPFSLCEPSKTTKKGALSHSQNRVSQADSGRKRFCTRTAGLARASARRQPGRSKRMRVGRGWPLACSLYGPSL